MTSLFLKLREHTSDMKYHEGKKKFASDALSRFQIKTQEDVHDVMPLSFIKFLDTVHIYHHYEHLTYTL